MSTDNEREIRGRLDAALGTIDPPGPPVNAVLRRGRNIRMRRRAAVAAGLAAVVGLGIALPGLVGHVRSAPPISHSYRVTVNRPHSTHSKVTFSGTTNGKSWRFAVAWDLGGPMLNGSGVPYNTLNDMSPAGQPANLSISGMGTRAVTVGQVRRDVSYLVLVPFRGPSIRLNAVRWRGHPWVGVELPTSLRLRRIVAYSPTGEVAYAVAFDNDADMWLAPGQRGPARHTARIASGTVDGKHWSYTGYAGPWGVCFEGKGGSGSGACLDANGAPLPHGQLVKEMTCGAGDAAGQIWTGQAAAQVSYVKFRLAHGRTLREVPATLAGYQYLAVEFGARQRLVSWTAYGGSGQVLGSGPVSPKC